MSLDVVKSKSEANKTLFKTLRNCLVLTILISWAPCVKNILFFLSLNQLTPITIENVTWNKPYVTVQFKPLSSNNSQNETLKYIRIHNKAHFDMIHTDLKNVLTHGYYSKKKPKKVFISRPFPFKRLIYATLITALYPLAGCYRRHEFQLGILNSLLGQRNKKITS